MSAPVIGISMYRDQASWGSWTSVNADVLAAGYADAVVAGGGAPVLLPAVLDADRATAIMAKLDGLVIAGGADVDPSRYGADAGPETTGLRPDRDASELTLLDAAAAYGTPTLGICRGMQLMAVHAGGSLHQHVPDLVGHQGHSPAPGVYGKTSVEIAPASQLAGILGDRVTVPCHHHQAVAEHPGFAPVARGADGILEAIEDPDRPFRIGVQWHPETDTDMRLFAALVAAATR